MIIPKLLLLVYDLMVDWSQDQHAHDLSIMSTLHDLQILAWYDQHVLFQILDRTRRDRQIPEIHQQEPTLVVLCLLETPILDRILVVIFWQAICSQETIRHDRISVVMCLVETVNDYLQSFWHEPWYWWKSILNWQVVLMSILSFALLYLMHDQSICMAWDLQIIP